MTRPQRRALAVTIALAAMGAIAAFGAIAATASAAPACPAATQCLTKVLITDGAPGLTAPFYVEDNEGQPPGHNAPMFWVDGFQAGSVNPVCAAATAPYAACQAALGGPPFNASGGHPVLGLCLRMGTAGCAQWAVLTPADIALLNAMRAAGITPRDLRMLGRWLHATGR